MNKLLKYHLDGIRDHQNRVGYVNGGIISSLLNHIDALDVELKVSREDEEEAVRKFGEAEQKIDRLIDNCKQLKQGQLRLQNEVEKASEAKKVVLPREVAEAIDLCRSNYITNFEIISLLNVTNQLFRDYLKSVIEALNTIKQFSFHNSAEDSVGDSGADLILKALVNGYTVEEPPSTEDRIEAKIELLLKENNVSNVVPVRELAVLLTLAVREVLADDRHEETAN